MVFKFNMGREGKAAELFLGDFNGLLQTDGSFPVVSTPGYVKLKQNLGRLRLICCDGVLT